MVMDLMTDLALEFPETHADLLALLRNRMTGDGLSVRLYVDDEKAFLKDLEPGKTKTVFYTDRTVKAQPGLKKVGKRRTFDIVVVDQEDEEARGRTLVDLVDMSAGLVICRRTSRHYSLRPLFLVAIPKSGTHLLMNMIEKFGYSRGLVTMSELNPKTWYALSHSHIHTSCKDFFRSSAMGGLFSNLGPPISNETIVFMYRDPRDILVSEAHWYQQPEAAIWSNMFSESTFEDRLRRLVDDPLLGTIRDRIMEFVPWLSFPNVIPVSFEELVGSKGGGDDLSQLRTIWSLMLRLQIDGAPKTVAEELFDPASPTFRAGQIGTWREPFEANGIGEMLDTLPTDYLEAFGYDGDEARFEKVSDGFRRKYPQFQRLSSEYRPVLVEAFEGWNIVQFQRKYFAFRQEWGELDLNKLAREQDHQTINGHDLEELKTRISVIHYTGLGVPPELAVGADAISHEPHDFPWVGPANGYDGQRREIAASISELRATINRLSDPVSHGAAEQAVEDMTKPVEGLEVSIRRSVMQAIDARMEDVQSSLTNLVMERLGKAENRTNRVRDEIMTSVEERAHTVDQRVDKLRDKIESTVAEIEAEVASAGTRLDAKIKAAREALDLAIERREDVHAERLGRLRQEIERLEIRAEDIATRAREEARAAAAKFASVEELEVQLEAKTRKVRLSIEAIIDQRDKAQAETVSALTADLDQVRKSMTQGLEAVHMAIGALDETRTAAAQVPDMQRSLADISAQLGQLSNEAGAQGSNVSDRIRRIERVLETESEALRRVNTMLLELRLSEVEAAAD
jgi:predicted  nucleic acid-binding Zn-ribbon protein